MPLAFPRYEDNIRLVRSPLAEVVCQVRYPPILTIPTTKPAGFQERIRRRFPDYEFEDSVVFQMAVSSGAPLPAARQQTANRTHRFINRRRGTTATLAEDFFALSTSKYTVWEEFARDLSLVSSAVLETYEPSYATRIGLRYVNVLDPEKLELSSLDDVVDLLKPDLTCLYRASVWDQPSEMAIQLILDDEGGRLGFRIGKRLMEDDPKLQLDFDYYQEDVEGLPIEDLVQRCERYHTVVYDAFRWSLAEDRIAVFDPVPKKEMAT